MENQEKNPPKKLLDRVRDRIRYKHYSIRTEEAYVSWIKRYILFHGKKHPADMGKTEIQQRKNYSHLTYKECLDEYRIFTGQDAE